MKVSGDVIDDFKKFTIEEEKSKKKSNQKVDEITALKKFSEITSQKIEKRGSRGENQKPSSNSTPNTPLKPLNSPAPAEKISKSVSASPAAPGGNVLNPNAKEFKPLGFGNPRPGGNNFEQPPWNSPSKIYPGTWGIDSHQPHVINGGLYPINTPYMIPFQPVYTPVVHATALPNPYTIQLQQNQPQPSISANSRIFIPSSSNQGAGLREK